MWQLAASLPFMFFPALCGRILHPRPPAIFNQLHLAYFLQDVILISTFPISPQLLRNKTHPRLSLSQTHDVFACNQPPEQKLPKAVDPSPPRVEGPPDHQTSKAQPPSTPSKRPPTSNKAPRRQAPARAMAITAATAARCLQALASLQNPPCRPRGWEVPSHQCRASRGRSRSR